MLYLFFCFSYAVTVTSTTSMTATMATLTTHNHQLQHHEPSTNYQAPHRIEMVMAGTAAEARDTTHLEPLVVVYFLYFRFFFFRIFIITRLISRTVTLGTMNDSAGALDKTCLSHM